VEGGGRWGTLCWGERVAWPTSQPPRQPRAAETAPGSHLWPKERDGSSLAAHRRDCGDNLALEERGAHGPRRGVRRHGPGHPRVVLVLARGARKVPHAGQAVRCHRHGSRRKGGGAARVESQALGSHHERLPPRLGGRKQDPLRPAPVLVREGVVRGLPGDEAAAVCADGPAPAPHGATGRRPERLAGSRRICSTHSKGRDPARGLRGGAERSRRQSGVLLGLVVVVARSFVVAADRHPRPFGPGCHAGTCVWEARPGSARAPAGPALLAARNVSGHASAGLCSAQHRGCACLLVCAGDAESRGGRV